MHAVVNYLYFICQSTHKRLKKLKKKNVIIFYKNKIMKKEMKVKSLVFSRVYECAIKMDDNEYTISK